MIPLPHLPHPPDRRRRRRPTCPLPPPGGDGDGDSLEPFRLIGEEHASAHPTLTCPSQVCLPTHLPLHCPFPLLGMMPIQVKTLCRHIPPSPPTSLSQFDTFLPLRFASCTHTSALFTCPLQIIPLPPTHHAFTHLCLPAFLCTWAALPLSAFTLRFYLTCLCPCLQTHTDRWDLLTCPAPFPSSSLSAWWRWRGT